MILLLDHDDSFVFTLSGYVTRVGGEPMVRRASSITLAEIATLAPSRIILSPGPGTPEKCALATEVVQRLGPTIPILGVCLGHQVIAVTYGATVARAAHPRHGRTSEITHDGMGILAGVPSPLLGTRYHSLSVDTASVPESLVVTAMADDGELMGVRHREYPVEGVQFHPESILTEHGLAMIRNFVER